MKIKFAEEDNHALRSLWYASNSAGLLSLVLLSSTLHLLHLSLWKSRLSRWSITTQGRRFTTFLFSFKGHLKMDTDSDVQPGHLGAQNWLIFILCVLASGKQEKKEAAGISYTTSVSPSQDTEGSEINLAAAPKIEHGPPLEQDADCVGTGRGHCGQQSYFCCATGPLGVDAHSFIRLPASRLGDTRRDTHTFKKNAPYMLYQWTISRSGTCCIWWNLLWRCLSYHFFFFVTRGYLCLFLPIWVYLYVSCLLVFELKDDGNTPGSQWPHVSDTVSLCLSLLPLLEVQHILAMLLDCTSSLILLLFSPYRWFTLAHRHECSLFATDTDNAQKESGWKCQQNDFLQFLFPSFVLSSAFLSYVHTRTLTNTHTSIVH